MSRPPPPTPPHPNPRPVRSIRQRATSSGISLKSDQIFLSLLNIIGFMHFALRLCCVCTYSASYRGPSPEFVSIDLGYIAQGGAFLRLWAWGLFVLLWLTCPCPPQQHSYLDLTNRKKQNRNFARKSQFRRNFAEISLQFPFLPGLEFQDHISTTTI